MNRNILEKSIKIPDTHVSVRKRKDKSLKVSRINRTPNYLKGTISTENKKSCKYTVPYTNNSNNSNNSNNINTLRRTTSETNLRNIKRSKMSSSKMMLRNEYYDEYNQFNNEAFGDDPYDFFS
jgi:hypothetical protein